VFRRLKEKIKKRRTTADQANKCVWRKKNSTAQKGAAKQGGKGRTIETQAGGMILWGGESNKQL